MGKRRSPFQMHRQGHVPRVWFNRTYFCGLVMSNPKVYYNKFADKDNVPGTRCMFRMYVPAPLGMRAFFNVWCMGPVADIVSEEVHKDDHVFLEGCLWTHDEKTKKEGQTAKRQFLSVLCQRIFQIPWRMDNYFKNDTVPVPKQEYHMMKMALDAMRQKFQVDPDVLREIGEEIPNDEFMKGTGYIEGVDEAFKEVSALWGRCDSAADELDLGHDEDEADPGQEDAGDESAGPRGHPQAGDDSAGPATGDDLEDGDVH